MEGIIGDDLHVHHIAHEVLCDALHERAEHVVTLALPLGERILLAHRAKVDSLLQIVHLFEVFAPTLVDDAQHDLTFDFTHDRLAELGFALRIERSRVGHDDVVHAVGSVGIFELCDRDRCRPVGRQLAHEALEIPFVIGLGDAVGLDQRVDRLGQVLHRRGAKIEALEDLVAALVDDLALLVHHFVVLEHVLADFSVALLDGGLRALDRLGDHLCLDGFIVGKRTAHHPTERTGGEQPHEFVVERQVET